MSCIRNTTIKGWRKWGLFCVTLFVMGGVSCNEADISGGTTATDGAALATGEASGNGLTITEIPTNQESSDNPLNGYETVAFSQYVYEKSDGSGFLIDFNFFPEGTDFDSVNKKAVLSCEVTSVLENVDVSVNAATETADDCDEVEINLAEATFTFLGIQIPSEDGSVSVFEDVFEFRITAEGFVDVFDDQIVSIEKEEANLENIYNAIMDRRIL